MANVLFPNGNQQEYYPVQQDLNFQQFNYQDYGQPQSGGPGYEIPGIKTNNIPTHVTFESIKIAFSTGGFDNEPPLLEGIFERES
jgi:hypothetical protein